MRRLKGTLFLAAGLLLAVLAGVVGFVTLAKATSQETSLEVASPRAMVVVAVRPVSVRSELSAGDVQAISMPIQAIPEGAIRAVDNAVGKLVLTDIYPGEILLSRRLLDPNVITADGRTALVLAEDKVLMAFPAQDLMSRISVLKPGDQIDVLFSFEFPASSADDEGIGANVGSAGAQGEDDKLSTFSLLDGVTISAIVGGKLPMSSASTKGTEVRPPDALLLALNPQDALILKYMLDAGGVADIVLRSPGEDRPLNTDPVDVDYVMNRYRIIRDLDR